MYSIELLETNAGYRFNFRMGDTEKIITWAGSNAAMNITDRGLAMRMKQTLERFAIFFDQDDNMIIPSPLYFAYSVQHTGIDNLCGQIENWPIFWSQDALFHRYENERVIAAQEGVSGPAKTYLNQLGLSSPVLPECDYSDWEELGEANFLPEEHIETLQNAFNALSDKEKIAVLYLAFNSPHLVSAMAWIKGAFHNDESFAHYTLVMEGIVVPVTMNPDDFEREVHLREDMFAELHFFMEN